MTTKQFATTTTTSNKNEGDDEEKDKEDKSSSSSSAATATATATGAATTSKSAAQQPFKQHSEWVKFQQSITVSGFQTGQTTTATVLKKSRGGKQARRKREQELALAARFEVAGATGATAGEDDAATDWGGEKLSHVAARRKRELALALTASFGPHGIEGPGGKISAVATKFPALRYSIEETAALLKEAYATLPKREGKRGSRAKKRQKNRWKQVRRNHSDYKAQLIAAHHRRMEHRQYKRNRTKEMKEEIAPPARQQDLEYQKMVLTRYLNMGLLEKNTDENYQKSDVFDDNEQENKI